MVSLKPGSATSYKCDYNSEANNNGFACADWIIKKGNMDFLHHNISVDEL